MLASCSIPRSVLLTPADYFNIYIYIYLLFLIGYTFFCKLVGEAMSALADNTNVPVTVKCRIGVDDHDSYEELCEFLLFF